MIRFVIRKRALEILRTLKEQDVRCEWVPLRVDQITEELLEKLSDLGVSGLFLGIESGSANTLKKISKGYSPELILEKTKVLAKFKNLRVCGAFIFGFPWETAAEFGETTALVVEIARIMHFRMAFFCTTYVPYPGSPILPEAQERGFTFPADYKKWADFDIRPSGIEIPWLSPRQITNMQRIKELTEMLYVDRKTSPLRWIVKYAFAVLALSRLKTGILAFPFEIRLYKALISVANRISAWRNGAQ